MIIYTDGEIGSKPITPAHRYSYQNDFAKILEDIERGEIPCGSGRPFPVQWANAEDAPSDGNQSWGSGPTLNGGGPNSLLNMFGMG